MGGATVQQTLTELVAKIGENMSVRRAAALTVDPGVVAAYVHNASVARAGQYRRAGGPEVHRRQGQAGRPGQAARHACRRRSTPGADQGASRQGRGRARVQCPEGHRAAVRQARSRRREDDGRPHAQVLRGSGAAAAGLHAGRRNPDRQADREGRPRTWAPRSRSKALSASRWARASRRPKPPTSPTKSPRWQVPAKRKVPSCPMRRNTAGSC